MPERTIKRRGEYSHKHSSNSYTVYWREHWKAQQLYNLTGKCSICGRTDRRTMRHHKDGVFYNHDENNIQELCNGCHTKQHITEGRKKAYLKRERNVYGQFC